MKLRRRKGRNGRESECRLRSRPDSGRSRQSSVRRASPFVPGLFFAEIACDSGRLWLGREESDLWRKGSWKKIITCARRRQQQSRNQRESRSRCGSGGKVRYTHIRSIIAEFFFLFSASQDLIDRKSCSCSSIRSEGSEKGHRSTGKKWNRFSNWQAFGRTSC